MEQPKEDIKKGLFKEDINFLQRDPFTISNDQQGYLDAILERMPDDHPLQVTAQTMHAVLFDRDMMFPNFKKAHRWAKAAHLAEENTIDSSKLWSLAALNFRMDADYLNAGNCSISAAKNAKKEKLGSSVVLKNFREAKVSFSNIGDDEAARDAHVKEFDYRKEISKLPVKVLLSAYKATSLYGESPLRVALTAISIISLCSIIYWLGGLNADDEVVHSWVTSFYFSVVTFTTLGYGDFSPTAGVSRFFATSEAVSGLILVSLFLVTFVRRYSR